MAKVKMTPKTSARIAKSLLGDFKKVVPFLFKKNPVRGCDCPLCERGRRFYKNTDSLPAKEREWMRGFYDAVMEIEEDAEMREPSDRNKEPDSGK